MRITLTVFILLVVFALAPPAAAQFETATVVGAVRDGSGAVIADAHVLLTHAETGVTQERRSNASGLFEFFNVRIGRQVLGVDAR